MSKRLVKKWILRKDGKRQRYLVSEKRLRKNREYDKHLRAWKLKEKVIAIPTPTPPSLSDIKQTMLKLFEEKATPRYEYYVKDGEQRRRLIGIKGYDNMHFKRDLDRDLEKAQVQDEGDGWYQLNAYTGKTANSAEVKIKYNPKQKLLRVYIRDYEL